MYIDFPTLFKSRASGDGLLLPGYIEKVTNQASKKLKRSIKNRKWGFIVFMKLKIGIHIDSMEIGIA